MSDLQYATGYEHVVQRSYEDLQQLRQNLRIHSQSNGIIVSHV